MQTKNTPTPRKRTTKRTTTPAQHHSTASTTTPASTASTTKRTTTPASTASTPASTPASTASTTKRTTTPASTASTPASTPQTLNSANAVGGFFTRLGAATGGTVQGAPTPPAVTVNSTRKVQQNRTTNNGVTAPSAGGKCAAVWVLCSTLAGAGAVVSAVGAVTRSNKPTIKVVRAAGAQQGLNSNNVAIEYYQWCKHHMVNGRG